MGIEVAEKSFSREDLLETLDPLVKKWFESEFRDFTPPQRYAIMHIHDRRSVLISAPTGSGKTLSAFLSIINELIGIARRGELGDQVYCIYISPLRALANDIEKNLLSPLRSMAELAGEEGEEVSKIRVGVRTGDTPTAKRQRMLKAPPHILITTPESLAIMLNSPRFKEKLYGVEWVIVDEIHELCSDKRGAHLSISLERLRHWTGKNFTRIGLSATIAPLEEEARFLVGYEEGVERSCVIVDTSFTRRMDLKLLCPLKDVIHAEAGRINRSMYRLLTRLVKAYKTTLIFTNTRSGAERVAYHLKKCFPEGMDEKAATHHGSLSKEVRIGVEDDLKDGKLKFVVSSTSLELGIDIGHIDLVVQIGSPKSIARCIQRTGRAGHALDRVAIGRILAVDRDDLVECAVMLRDVYRGDIDRVHIPRNCLDVLAQHLVGMALNERWDFQEALKVIRASYCYRDLGEEAFEGVLRYLSGSYSDLRSNRVYGKIWADFSERRFGRRGKYTRVIYMTNVGTIPDQVAIKVYAGRVFIGKIDEDFLEKLSPGDIFILAGKTWRFLGAKGARARVQAAPGIQPTVPTWIGEMLPLSFDLGVKIGGFREEIFKRLVEGSPREELVKYIAETCHTDDHAANSIYEYFLEEYLFLKGLGVTEYPSHRNILVEDYVDERDQQNVIFHFLVGRRANDALSRAYGLKLMERIRRNVAISITDNGFILTLPEGVRIDPEELLSMVDSQGVTEIVREAVERTELMVRRFRHCAARALMILRDYKGHEISVNKQQINAQILLQVCKGLPRFPVVEETFREILEDDMDLEHVKEVLEEIGRGEKKFILLPRCDVPSPFAHGLLLVGMSDVILMESRREILERFHKMVMERISS